MADNDSVNSMDNWCYYERIESSEKSISWLCAGNVVDRHSQDPVRLVPIELGV